MNYKKLLNNSNGNNIYVDIDNISKNNYLQRNTQYDIGNCVQSYDLLSWLYLECIKEGTTTDKYIDLISTHEGDIIQDGSATFIIKSIGNGFANYN